MAFAHIFYEAAAVFACCISGLQAQDGVYPPIQNVEPCTGLQQGTVDRSDRKIRIGIRNWLTAELASYAYYYVLKEVMRYDVELLDLSTAASTKNWGREMDAGLYDFEMESWQASSASLAYLEFAVSKQSVEVGDIGYGGRSGMFSTPGALVKQPFADYYLFYTNPALIKDAGYVMFGEQLGLDAIKDAVGDAHPNCESEQYPWCGEVGTQFENSYVPPQCQNNPEDCAIAFMHSPSYDTGYFEQLTTNHNLMLIHQYTNGQIEPVVNAITAAGREALFYYWVPDPIPTRLNGQRISYPDFTFGCAGGDTATPDGPTRCDYGDFLLNKLARISLGNSDPAALYVFRNTAIYGNQLDLMISWSTAGGGNLTKDRSACRWLQENPNIVERWAPECVSRPPPFPKDGDLLFNERAITCEAAARFPEVELTEVCFEDPSPGKVDRTDVVIRAGLRGWSSQALATYATALVLKEWLGYTVLMTDISAQSTKNFGPEMEGGGYDFDVENWQAGTATERYQTYIVERQTVKNPGPIGFTGRSGIFMFPGAKNYSIFSSYWRFYKDQAMIDSSNFLKYPGTPDLPSLQEALGDDFPSCYEDWCGSTLFEGMWVPPICQDDPTDCLLVVHAYTNYDQGYFEQLTQNLGLKLIFAYYGVSHHWGVIDAYFRERKKDLLFYFWTPDRAVASTGSIRLSFPDNSLGCNAGDTKAPTGPIECDYGDTDLQKLVSKNVQDLAPQAYMFLSNWQIFKDGIDRMLKFEADGAEGDTRYNTSFKIACEFAKENFERIGRVYAPPCVSDPIPVENLKIGDRTFDAATFTCPEVQCNPDQVLQTTGGVSCRTCGLGQRPNDDKLDCVTCEPGTVPDRSQGICVNCSLGYFCPFQNEVADPCPQGSFASQASMTECVNCPEGEYQPLEGQSACEVCSSPMTTNLVGAKLARDCICPQNWYKPSNATNATGYPWAADTVVCISCPNGLECAKGSDQSYMPCDGNRLISKEDRTELMLSRSPEGKPLYPIPPPKFFSTCDDKMGLSAYKCLTEQACPGNDVNECGGGTEGIACGRCKDGYYKSEEECMECNDVEASSAIFPILPLVVAPPCIVFLYCVSRDRLEKWNSPANYLASALFVVLVYIQTLAAISACYLQKPPAMSGSSEWTSYAFELMSLLRPGCTTFSDFQTSFIGKLLLPIYALVLFVFVFVCSVIIGFCTHRFRMNGDITLNCYFSLFNTFFIGIAQQTFTLFQCYEHPNEEKSMRSQADVLCESAQWNDLVAVALVAVVVFCGGFLALNIYVVVVAPLKFVQPRFQMRFKFAFIKYRPSIWWWGVVMLIKGIWLNMPTVVFDTGTAQMVWLEGIIVSYFVLSFGLFPWRSFLVAALDVMQHAFLIFLFGFVPHFIPNDEPEIDDRIGVAYAFFSMCPLAVGACCIALLVIKRLCPRITYADWNGSAEEVCTTFSEIRDPQLLAKILSQMPWSDIMTINATRNILRSTYLFDKHPKPLMAKSTLLNSSMTKRLQAESEVSDYMGSDYSPQHKAVPAKEEECAKKDNIPEPEAEHQEDVPPPPQADKNEVGFTRGDVLDALDFPPEQMHDMHVMSDLIGLLTPRFEPIGAPRTPRSPMATPRDLATPRDVATPRDNPKKIDDDALPMTPR